MKHKIWKWNYYVKLRLRGCRHEASNNAQVVLSTAPIFTLPTTKQTDWWADERARLLYIACILLWNLSEGTVRVQYEGTKWANFKQSVHNFHDNVWALSRKVAHKVELYCEPLVIFIICAFAIDLEILNIKIFHRVPEQRKLNVQEIKIRTRFLISCTLILISC